MGRAAPAGTRTAGRAVERAACVGPSQSARSCLAGRPSSRSDGSMSQGQQSAPPTPLLSAFQSMPAAQLSTDAAATSADEAAAACTYPARCTRRSLEPGRRTSQWVRQCKQAGVVDEDNHHEGVGNVAAAVFHPQPCQAQQDRAQLHGARKHALLRLRASNHGTGAHLRACRAALIACTAPTGCRMGRRCRACFVNSVRRPIAGAAGDLPVGWGRRQPALLPSKLLHQLLYDIALLAGRRPRRLLLLQLWA
eukprot:scaffold631_cov378-Prasinococcus_capsulatus_cf.AAC.5